MKDKGFTLVELMTVVAILGILMLMAFPAYQAYVARVKIAEIINITMNMGSQINTAYIAGFPDGHEYTYDNLAKLAGEPQFKRDKKRCMFGKSAYEYHWTDKTAMSKILGIDAKHIKQLGFTTYRTTDTCKNKPNTDNYFQQYVFFAIDEESFGLPKTPSNVGGSLRYLNNIITITFSSENVYYYSKNGPVERIATNGSPTCGVWYGADGSSDSKYFTIPKSYITQVCRYISTYIDKENRRHLVPW